MTNWPLAIGVTVLFYLIAILIGASVLSSRGIIRLPRSVAALLNAYVGTSPMRFAKVVAAGFGALLFGTILVVMMISWSHEP